MLVPSVRKSLGDVDAAGDPYVLERLDVFEKCLYVWNYVCVPHNLGMMHQTHDSPGNIVVHVVKVCSVCLEDLPWVPKSCLDTVDVVEIGPIVEVPTPRNLDDVSFPSPLYRGVQCHHIANSHPEWRELGSHTGHGMHHS